MSARVVGNDLTELEGDEGPDAQRQRGDAAADLGRSKSYLLMCTGVLAGSGGTL